MEKTKVISFIGLEREDIPYYLMKGLTEKGKNVLMVDNTTELKLYNCMPKLDENTESVERDHMILITNRKFSDDCYEKFDVVIVMHGLEPDEEILEHSDMVVFVTSFMYTDLLKLQRHMDAAEVLAKAPKKSRISYLYIDKASGKISVNTIRKMLGLAQVPDEYTIPVNENDVAMRHNLQYNGDQGLKGLSSEMRYFVKMMIVEMEKKKKKQDDDEEE